MEELITVVTSLAEVWIEITLTTNYIIVKIVTSLAEVWIEIWLQQPLLELDESHFPCGSVD